jgi:two-component system, LytTR family, sensor kinase
MAKSSGRGGALVAIFAAWTLFGLFFAGQAYLGQTYLGRGLSWDEALLRWMPCAYAWALLTPLVLGLNRRFPITRERWLPALLVHVPCSVAFSAAGMLLYALGQQLLSPGGQFFTREAFARLLLAALHIDLLIYAGVVGAGYAIDHYRRYRERELTTAQLQAALARAELATLRSQLHPHFLFNTLNTISILLEEDARAARTMLVHLGDLLRMLLQPGRLQEVTLREELAILESYLAIERMRFQDRLDVKWTVDPATLDAKVPDLLLQPLVENAIKHGIVPRPSGGRVEISAHRQGGQLRLEVRDDGPGLSPAQRSNGRGLGLANTRERLERLYGARHCLELNAAVPAGLSVVLTLPFLSPAAPCPVPEGSPG